MDLYFRSSYQEVPGACVLDITPPTFAGITGLTASDGYLTATRGAATDAVSPIEFDVYVQAGTAVGLFSSGNLQQSSYLSSIRIFTDASGVFLAPGQTYHVGIRARDRSGNVDSNTASLSAVSTGVSFAGISAAVWNSVRASFVTSGSFGEALQGLLTAARANNLDNLDATISSVLTAIGAIPVVTPPTVSQIVDGVWDEPTSAHVVSGSFGANAQAPAINPTQVADAVWDAVLADHLDAGSTGKKLSDGSSGGGGGGGTSMEIQAVSADMETQAINFDMEIESAEETI